VEASGGPDSSGEVVRGMKKDKGGEVAIHVAWGREAASGSQQMELQRELIAVWWRRQERIKSL